MVAWLARRNRRYELQKATRIEASDKDRALGRANARHTFSRTISLSTVLASNVPRSVGSGQRDKNGTHNGTPYHQW